MAFCLIWWDRGKKNSDTNTQRKYVGRKHVRGLTGMAQYGGLMGGRATDPAGHGSDHCWHDQTGINHQLTFFL